MILHFGWGPLVWRGYWQGGRQNIITGMIHWPEPLLLHIKHEAPPPPYSRGDSAILTCNLVLQPYTKHQRLPFS